MFPEWLRAKYAFQDTLKPDMVVIGTPDRIFSEYRGEKTNFTQDILNACCWHDEAIVVDPEEAVLIKLTANALASTKISFANMIYLICKKRDLRSDVVMNAIKKDPRCSPVYLTPGSSFGGYCLPKDTEELSNCSSNGLLKAVLQINEKMKELE